MRAVAIIFVSVCIATMGCRSVDLRDTLAQGQKSGICPVHQLAMAMTAVPLGYGFYVGPSDGPDAKFSASRFPFAQWFAMDGGPMVVGESKSTEELYHCPDCEKAKLDWIARHPASEWGKTELASYERVSRLRLGKIPDIPRNQPTASGLGG